MNQLNLQILLALGEANDGFWISGIGQAGTDTEGLDISLDSEGSMYVPGKAGSTFFLCKLNANGTITWQRMITLGPGTSIANSVDIRSGDVLVAGSRLSATEIRGAQYSTDGTLVQQLMMLSGSLSYGSGVAAVGTSDACITGLEYDAGSVTFDLILGYINNLGTISWQQRLGVGGRGFDERSRWDVAVSNDNFIYVTAASYDSGALQNRIVVAKYSTAGTLVWQRRTNFTVELSVEHFPIAISSSNDVHVGFGNLIAKLGADGSLTWGRSLLNANFRSVAVDSGGNVYACGWVYDSGTNLRRLLIAKWNSAGTLQWQRVLYNGYTEGAGVAVDSNGYMTISGYYTQGTDKIMLTARLPDDGSRTGVYGDFTYATSSLTAVSLSSFLETSSYTSAVSSLTTSLPVGGGTTSSVPSVTIYL